MFVLSSIYYLYTPQKYRSTLGVWGVTALTILLLFVAQIFLSYVYFVNPFLQKNSQIYKQIILPFLIILYVILFSIAVYISSLKFRTAISQILSEKERGIEDSVLSIKVE